MRVRSARSPTRTRLRTGATSRAASLLLNCQLDGEAYEAIYTMIERAQLPGVVRIGRRVLVREDALLDWLRQKSTPSLER